MFSAPCQGELLANVRRPNLGAPKSFAKAHARGLCHIVTNERLVCTMV